MMSQEDKGGLAAETSFARGVQRDFYQALLFWDSLHRDSAAAGLSLDGRVCVLDMQCSFDRAVAPKPAKPTPQSRPPQPTSARPIAVLPFASA